MKVALVKLWICSGGHRVDHSYNVVIWRGRDEEAEPEAHSTIVAR